MTEPTRRLAAILAADVVGYSRLIAEDEARTLDALRALRRELFEPLVEEHRGAVVKRMGDGWLVSFGSVVDAAQCAIQVQERLSGHDRIKLRIGVHLGDIVHEDEDIYGDGVNIASRLQEIAEPGGVLISGTAYESVIGRLDSQFEDAGDQNLKNVARPIRAWRWRAGTEAPLDGQATTDDVFLGKPSVAVLAFENLSSDPENDFFGDGIAEEIITMLSKVSSLLIIARNSSFAYKGKAIDLRQVGQELGVRYVLEGSIRAAGGRIRVSSQLTDAETGQHIWADRFDRSVEDIFAVQDEITREIVTALRLKLTDGEQAQIWLRETDSVEAWGCAMPALELLQAGTAESVAAARNLLEKAVSIDPNYAAAYSMIAQSHWFDLHWGYVSDLAEAARQIGSYAKMALDRASDSGHAHLMKAAYELESGNREAAHEAGSHACRLSPNNAFVRVGFARISIDAGFPADAEIHMRAAMRLNPFYPAFYNGILANALELQGKDRDALAQLRNAITKNPGYFAGHLRLASLLALTGDIEQAQYHALEAQRLNPRFGMEGLSAFYRAPDEAARKRFLQGLKSAGMTLGTTDQS